MSEVKRFYAGEFSSHEYVIKAEDFDRVTAERDAALAENGPLRENIAAQILERTFEYHALQQRVAVLEGLLREIRQSCELSKLRDAQIDAALKPAEGGGDEYRKSCEVAHKAMSMENQRIVVPGQFKCLACGDIHPGTGNLPCPKMSPTA